VTSAVVNKTPVPPARSPQVIQAKADLRANKLNILRANLQKTSQARPVPTPEGASGRGEKVVAGRGPKPSPNFRPPTNPPQPAPQTYPAGYRVRVMPATEQYPNGYWRLEKPMDNGGWQGINPSTMKPGGGEWDTHVPLPPKN
jgi:hypothetical protein